MASARDNIPTPRGLPIIGNILDVQDEVPIRGIERLTDLYGSIFKLNFLGRKTICIASAELLEELCDETRFWKTPSEALAALADNKAGAEKPRRGLFSAPSTEDEDWQQAHRTLMPAFGPLSIQQMFGEMHDLCSQLVLKWARLGPSFRIPVTQDFTRLTLDTIGLCAMDYRFNSFYKDEMDPFVQALNSSLTAASDRNKVGSILKRMMPWDRSGQKVQIDREYMTRVSTELIQHRRNNPTEKRDLLNAMVLGKDPKTGKHMPDGLISANIITFLIAGHDTTSGLLSFAFFNLLKSSEAYFKAQQEIDRVLGRNKLKPEHLKDLKYIDAVLRETLRLNPTVPAFIRSIRKDNQNDVEALGGGEYAIRRDDRVLCLISKCQRDPKVYGEDANEFRPERMLDENFQRLPKGAWKGFGTGIRACIGRGFAWQEAQMAFTLLLQNFNFRLDDPSYEIKIKQTLTVKPDEFYMRATLREAITATSLQTLLSSSGEEVNAAADERTRRTASGLGEGLKPMMILYGSNTGTCISLAQKMSVDAKRHGYQAEVMEMDAAVGVLPKDQAVAIITASYEGQPPDNAGQFVAWLESMQDSEALRGVQYAVFGCGHSDWATTYQRIPTLVDDLLEKHGGKRIVDRGLSNAAAGDMFSDFDIWSDHTLWPAVAPSKSDSPPTTSAFELEMSTQNRSSYLRQDVQLAAVVAAKRLTASREPEKRHLEIKLPDGMSYVAGDYLAILPLNPAESVARIQRHFKVPRDATLTIKPGAPTFLPTGQLLSVADLLRDFVELSLPATKNDVAACVAACTKQEQKDALQTLEASGSSAEHRMSLLDLLERHSGIEMTFSIFLSRLPPLRPRHYSISSSPLADPETCTITYGIIDEAAKSGVGRYIGVTGAYLSSLKSGDEISVSVRATNKFFHLPNDPSETPVIMFGAGTGIAPFRGFIQERAELLKAGRKLAPAILFMGCRAASADRLYATELDEWAKAGAVDVRYAFSREASASEDCKYVQDRMLRDKKVVRELWEAGAKVFTCGSPAVTEGIGAAALQILKEAKAEQGEITTDEEAAEWFRKLRNERFVVDVFA
ncbi:hypothetical protein B0A55_08835 [Friedmanniomyces simplex]|uniref:Bifunctional cytochrome P450/NADPH--P450 reductase n=1 Tax=Friedmanniomyces simplex TaxID=329884 RepID=A0A4U0X894_9PEZI|nr:hypothetical protein B0A55_08835 [Friedmanniomyces simplex]